MHGEQLGVLLVRHDVPVRAHELDPDQHRHDPGAAEERGDQVKLVPLACSGLGVPTAVAMSRWSQSLLVA